MGQAVLGEKRKTAAKLNLDVDDTIIDIDDNPKPKKQLTLAQVYHAQNQRRDRKRKERNDDGQDANGRPSGRPMDANDQARGGGDPGPGPDNESKIYETDARESDPG